MRRLLSISVPLALALAVGLPTLLAGCGSEAPQPGNLVVESDPPGAAITLDGTPTSHVTPFTFESLEGGTNYTVAVAIEGWTSFPTERSVNVPFGSSVTTIFELSQAVGSLSVSSSPAGAAIFIDGAATGEVTPFTFEALVPGDYTVTVELENHVSQPAEISVTVTDGGEADADFTLVVENVPMIVLLEGFSNTFCIGCPTLNANLDFVLHEEGYGRDRLLYIKWPAYLSPLDPFWRLTQELTNGRVDWYFGSSSVDLPTLVGGGNLLGGHGTPPNGQGILDFVDAQPEFADVMISVATDEDLTDIEDLAHDATIVLNAPGNLDLTGYELNVVLVYEEVITQANYPYGNGDEFHWVMRDFVRASADLGVLTGGTEYPFDVTLEDPLGGEIPGQEVYPVNKQVIAWIQHGTNRDVVQAGSTVEMGPGPVPASVESAVAPAPHSGGSR